MPNATKHKSQTTQVASKKIAASSKKVAQTCATSTPSGKHHGVFLRSQLVGKFPEIKHQPAPKEARHVLSEEDRKNLVARMVLI